jgi:hypothetical protein
VEEVEVGHGYDGQRRGAVQSEGATGDPGGLLATLKQADDEISTGAEMRQRRKGGRAEGRGAAGRGDGGRKEGATEGGRSERQRR